MKTLLHLTCFLFFLLVATTATAQADCRSILKKAIAAYAEGKGDLDKALQYLQDTEICDYKDTLLKERQALQKNIFDAIKKQKAAVDTALVKANRNIARYYSSEARQLLAEDNSCLAYLLIKEALKKDPNNKEARYLYDTLPNYLSDRVFSNAKFDFSPDSNYLMIIEGMKDGIGTLHIWNTATLQPILTSSQCYNNFYNFSSDSHFLTFQTKVNDTTINLNLLNLNKDEQLRTFPNSSNTLNETYSPDNKFMTFSTYVSQEQSVLNLLALDKNEPPRTFPGSDNYRYSSDYKFFTFFTSVNGNQGTINLSALDKDEPPRTFPNSYTYQNNYSYSSDNKFLTFFTNLNNTTYLRECLNFV